MRWCMSGKMMAGAVLGTPPHLTQEMYPPMPNQRTPEDRFWSKVDKSGDCWEWRASRDSYGYGHAWVRGKLVQSHRFAYIAMRGPIAAGLTIDHLCRNRGCANPAHMEVVSRGENIRRSSAWHHFAAAQLAKTHCPRGHEYTPENTYLQDGFRSCRYCRNNRPKGGWK
jgi:hypothetical protein